MKKPMTHLGKILTMHLCVLMGYGAQAQTHPFDWVRQIEGNTIQGYDATVDAAGNMYVIGNFTGPVDLDPGPGIETFFAGQLSAFVQKLDPAGNLIWALSFTGNTGELVDVRASALDASGNIYLTGSYGGTLDADPGQAVFNLPDAGLNRNGFLIKLGAAGNFLAAYAFTGTTDHTCNPTAIDVAPSGEVFLAGSFSGTVDFDPGTGVANRTTNTPADPFVLRLDASGSLDWAHRFTTNIGGHIQTLGATAAGEVYAAGIFRGTIDLDPDSGTQWYFTSGGNDRFLVKFDASGNYVWGNAIGNSRADEVSELVIAANGDVYTTGFFSQSLDFDPGPGDLTLTSYIRDAYVEKVDASGNVLWAKSIRGNVITTGNALTLDALGNIFVLGSFTDTADFDPGAGTVQLVSDSGSFDVFLLKLDEDGIFQEVYHIEGSGHGTPIAVEVSPLGEVYSMGEHTDMMDFDPGPGTALLQNQGVFIQKLHAAPLSVAEVSEEHSIRVYPNPATEGIFIEGESALSGSIDLMDQTGRILFSAHAEGQQMYVNLESYAPGVYFIAVGDGSGRSVHKIIRY